MFGFQFFFILENTKNIKFNEQEEFSENIKKVFSVFSKTVLKNSFQKHEPNMPIVSNWCQADLE